MRKKTLRQKPRRVLRLPDLDHAKTAVLSTLGSPDSQRCYRKTRLRSTGDLAWLWASTVAGRSTGFKTLPDSRWAAIGNA